MSALNAVTGGMRRIVRLVAILNLTYFGVEFAVALGIGSVSLFADSIDFLEDTAVNFLILLAVDWSARYRARMGMVLAGVLLVPGVATLWTGWRKFTIPAPPSPLALSLAGAGALAVNGDFPLRKTYFPCLKHIGHHIDIVVRTRGICVRLDGVHLCGLVRVRAQDSSDIQGYAK